MSSGDECSREGQSRKGPEAQPKDVLTLSPQVCRPEPEGRLDTIWPVDLGEQVVGSKHEFEVPAPRNLSSVVAVGQALVTGSGDLSVAWPMSKFGASTPAGPLRLTYAPSAAGVRHATLTLIVKWTDGHVETRHVQVTARARGIDDIPASHKNNDIVKEEVPPEERKKSADRSLQVDEGKKWRNADNAYAHLLREQERGVSLVANEAKKFRPKPAARSLWQDLAELAFQLGTGAIAGLVSRYVANRVANVFVNSASPTALAETGKQGIGAAQKAMQTAQGDPVAAREVHGVWIAKKVDNYATEDRAAHAKWAEGELTGQLAGAVGRAVSMAATEIRGPQGGSKGAASTQQEQNDAPDSEDGELAFFSSQQSMIDEAGMKGSVLLDSAIAEILKGHPDVAPELMDELVGGFNDAARQAKQSQAEQTAEKFFTYLARTNLGTQTVKDADGTDKVVTDMSAQRHFKNPLLTPSLASGVLEIEATREQEGGHVAVTGARAKDISYLAANRLRDAPLAHSGVPIRVSLYGGLTIITLDEAGRVRFAGGPLTSEGPNTEVQQLKEAQRIVDAVLSKTLAAWGVQQVQTNDANQPAMKRKSGECQDRCRMSVSC